MLESMRKLMAASDAARSAPPAALPAPGATARRRGGARQGAGPRGGVIAEAPPPGGPRGGNMAESCEGMGGR